MIAHINEKQEEQSLQEHCQRVAFYTAAALQSVRLSKLGYLIGLLHDMGKATQRFDTYIRKSHAGEGVRRGSVNHTFAGVIYIWEQYHDSKDMFQMLTAELVAYAIGAHHGLFDCVGFDEVGKGDFEYRIQKDKEELCYAEAVQNFLAEVATEGQIDELFKAAVTEVKEAGSVIRRPFYCGLVARLLVSAVIDADRQDTAEFMDKTLCEKQAGDSAFWQRNLQYCENKIAKFSQDSAIQRVRGYVSDACRQKAKEMPGIYQLNVPTGGGKTISVLRYSLAHAKQYEKSRIIFIIPLLSVLEQNSGVIKDYMLDKHSVAEHHSNVVIMGNNEDELKRYELIANNWGAPVIVSTLVQFLNILFLDKTTAIRRMQSLCNSVIVIDEVQSLPWKLTNVFIEALNFLAEFCNCTIVLSSATQPCFDKLNKVKLHLAQKKDLVVPDPQLYQAFARTTIIDKTTPAGYTVVEIAEFADELLQQVSSALIICNTKRTAMEIYKQAQNRGYTVYHLSTGMCMAHRLSVVKQIIEDLEYNQQHEEKRKILCVSTQLVEAGVDFSFERVIRLLAGIDNIVQSAGRENRSGDYGLNCPCYIMNLQNENIRYLKDIKIRQDATMKLLNAFSHYPESYDNNLASEKSVDTYYQCLLQPLADDSTLNYVEYIDGVRYTLYDLLCNGVKTKTPQIMKQAFKTVGENFDVFDMKNQDVIVPYGETGAQLISDLLSEKTHYDLKTLKALLKQASQYSINLFAYQIKELGNQITRYTIGDETFYLLNEDKYDGALTGVGFRVDSEQEVLIF